MILRASKVPLGGLLERPWLDSDNFMIRESSGNHPAIILKLSWIWLGWLGWPCILGGAGFFGSSTKTNVKSTRNKKKKKKQNLTTPPDLFGGTFADILPGGDVCKFLAKIQPQTGKRPSCTNNTVTYIKNI